MKEAMPNFAQAKEAEPVLSPEEQAKQEKAFKKQEYIKLAKTIENKEYPFPGLKPEAYAKLKAEEAEYASYNIPVEIAKIDELVERFKAEGFKVVLGDHPESGNVFVLPCGSNDIVKDNLFPRHLASLETLDDDLKKLIKLNEQK